MLLRIIAAGLFLALFNGAATRAQLPLRDRPVEDSLLRLIPAADPAGKVDLYCRLAEFTLHYESELSFSYAVSAFRIAFSEHSDSLKGRSRMMLGSCFLERRKFMKAQEQFLAAAGNFRRSGDLTGEANAYGDVGILHRTLENYTESALYLKTAAELVKKSDTATYGTLLHHLAMTYQTEGDWETADFYLNLALNALRRAGDSVGVSLVMNTIGAILIDQERYDEALAYYESLLKTSDTTRGDVAGLLYTRTGHIHYKKKDFRASLRCNKEALRLRQKGRHPIVVNSSLINIAADYFNLGKPDSARIFMDSGLRQAVRYDRRNLLRSAYRHLYEYYEGRGDYNNALNFFGRYANVSDAINREKYCNNSSIAETRKEVARLRESGEILQTASQINELRYSRSKIQQITVAAMTGVAGFSMCGFIIWLLFVSRMRKQMQDLNIRLSDEIREREQTEQQIRDREVQYKFITENTIDFIIHLDAENNTVYASPACRTLYGYQPEELTGRMADRLMHPDFTGMAMDSINLMTGNRTSQQITYIALRKDGSQFWVESIMNPMFDPLDGSYRGLVGVTRDIQERKTKQLQIMEGTKQKENLLKEIHHRVKNNFAILVSLINMQLAQSASPEVKQSLTNLQLRIRTMALVHEMLYRSGDFEKISFPGYLRSLASVIAGTYNRRNIGLTIDAEESVLDIETLIPLGLIVNELLSNAYKHGFPGERNGSIRILYTIDPATRMHVLFLGDDGIGMPGGTLPDKAKSMGLQVVEILCAQIEARLEFANSPGAGFTISFRAREERG